MHRPCASLQAPPSDSVLRARQAARTRARRSPRAASSWARPTAAATHASSTAATAQSSWNPMAASTSSATCRTRARRWNGESIRGPPATPRPPAQARLLVPIPSMCAAIAACGRAACMNVVCRGGWQRCVIVRACPHARPHTCVYHYMCTLSLSLTHTHTGSAGGDAKYACSFPGCRKQRYTDSQGLVHDFCGRTHAFKAAEVT